MGRSYPPFSVAASQDFGHTLCLTELHSRRFLRMALMRSEESGIEGAVAVRCYLQPKAGIGGNLVLARSARTQDIRGAFGWVARADLKVDHDLEQSAALATASDIS